MTLNTVPLFYIKIEWSLGTNFDESRLTRLHIETETPFNILNEHQIFSVGIKN